MLVFGIDIVGGLIEGVSWIMLTVAQICIALTVFFLRFFITLASYNNYIDVSVVKLGWAMVRDVANMFFVVALLVIAFATILGLEQYEWKKGLIKLIVMAVFINFSNLIAQLIIDAAHVFTITFLNAISATAGGNLINMFKLDAIVEMVSDPDLGTTPEGASTALFGSSIVASIFAILAAVALGSYVIVMALRVVILWALIILSPLAYLLYALPKGEKYAQEWWSEFFKHVIVAPIMVFFLWLAFATLGSGTIMDEIMSDKAVVPLRQGEEAQSISLSKVSTWENMANYLIALVFLMIGLRKTQESGAEGAGLVGGAVNFGKKVATIATGYAAGRWLTDKAAPAIGKKVAMTAPIIGGRNWKRLGSRISERAKESKIGRHIPFIGVGAEYHEKLDKRVADHAKFNKEARMAMLSYEEEAYTKVPVVGGILKKHIGLKASSMRKRKGEARMQSAMTQKEEKTAMKKLRTESKIRELGIQHIEASERKAAKKWAKETRGGADSFGSEEEMVRQFNAVTKQDDGEGKKWRDEVGKNI